MARANRKATTGRGTAEQIVSGAIGAAEALTVGVVQMTGRTLIETLHAVEEIGSELGSAVVRAARGSIKAAEDIGGDLVTVGKDVSRRPRRDGDVGGRGRARGPDRRGTRAALIGLERQWHHRLAGRRSSPSAP